MTKFFQTSPSRFALVLAAGILLGPSAAWAMDGEGDGSRSHPGRPLRPAAEAAAPPPSPVPETKEPKAFVPPKHGAYAWDLPTSALKDSEFLGELKGGADTLPDLIGCPSGFQSFYRLGGTAIWALRWDGSAVRLVDTMAESVPAHAGSDNPMGTLDAAHRSIRCFTTSPKGEIFFATGAGIFKRTLAGGIEMVVRGGAFIEFADLAISPRTGELFFHHHAGHLPMGNNSCVYKISSHGELVQVAGVPQNEEKSILEYFQEVSFLVSNAEGETFFFVDADSGYVPGQGSLDPMSGLFMITRDRKLQRLGPSPTAFTARGLSVDPGSGDVFVCGDKGACYQLKDGAYEPRDGEFPEFGRNTSYSENLPSLPTGLGPAGDGLPANKVALSYLTSMAFTPEGDLLLAEHSYADNALIWKIEASPDGSVRPENRIVILAGGGKRTHPSELGTPVRARDARLGRVTNLTPGLDGELHFTQVACSKDRHWEVDQGDEFYSLIPATFEQICKITSTGHLVAVAGSPDGVVERGGMVPALTHSLNQGDIASVLQLVPLTGGGLVARTGSGRFFLIGPETDQNLGWLVLRGQAQIRQAAVADAHGRAECLAQLSATVHAIKHGFYNFPDLAPVSIPPALGRREVSIRMALGRRECGLRNAPRVFQGVTLLEKLRKTAAMNLLKPGLKGLQLKGLQLPEATKDQLEALRASWRVTFEGIVGWPQRELTASFLADALAMPMSGAPLPPTVEAGPAGEEGKEESKGLLREGEVAASASSSTSSSPSSSAPAPAPPSAEGSDRSRS